MDLFQFLRILLKNAAYIVVIPIGVAILVYLSTTSLPQKYIAETTIFTGITSNNSIDNMGGGNVDYFATQNAFNNILSILRSESVIEETSLRLLALHLVQTKPVANIISNNAYKELQKIITKDVRLLIVKNNEEQTYTNLENSIIESNDNFVYALLNFDHPHYSTEAISKIQANRIASSDMVNISYENNDAAITYHTVRLLSEVFVKHYNNLKGTQTGSAVEYFEKQLAKSALSLKESEDKLLIFNTENEIINYYEQTKHISSQQEKIDIELQEKKMNYMASDAVLEKMEVETQKRFNINLRNKEILDVRQQLILVNEKMASIELSDKGEDAYAELKTERSRLESTMKSKIDSLYIFESNSQGIEQEKLLGDWLNAVTEYESSKAEYSAMKNRKVDFMQQYRTYAPLGAKLKRIEREISVNEQEYLEILHHLGLARLKQQNAEMLSNMKILDEPRLPIDPMPNKRKMYVIISAVLSFLFYLVGLFVMELVDKRVRSSERLKAFTNTTVISSFCTAGFSESNNIITETSLTHLIEPILIKRSEVKNDTPVIIQLFSIWEGEGKSHILTRLNKRLISLGKKTFCINFNEVDGSLNLTRISDIKKYASNDNELDFVIVEYPAVYKGITNPSLIKQSDVNILMVDAMRTWSKADVFHITKLKGLLSDNLFSTLTNANPNDLEDVFGEIPKKRGVIKKFIKYKLFKRIL